MTDTHRQTGGRTKPMATLLAEELAEIYSTPTPKGWRKLKGKGIGLYWSLEISITIAGVQYLYPRPDHESWSNMTDHITWKRK